MTSVASAAFFPVAMKPFEKTGAMLKSSMSKRMRLVTAMRGMVERISYPKRTEEV
jgi:hypothetical protein